MTTTTGTYLSPSDEVPGAWRSADDDGDPWPCSRCHEPYDDCLASPSDCCDVCAHSHSQAADKAASCKEPDTRE